MSTDRPSGSVMCIPRERVEEAVEILALAFEHDPAIQYLFSDARQKSVYHDQVRELFRLTCAARFDAESPPLGHTIGARLVGVACVARPTDKRPSDSLIKKYEGLKSTVGQEATHRLEAHGQLVARYRPEQPNYHLIVIGVHPEARGEGYGRVLLDAVHELSEADPMSTGVALDTANTANVSLYEHFGYAISAKDYLEHVPFWFMFRSNGTQGDK
jgi:GNAT superfamily N-acetyltransferase